MQWLIDIVAEMVIATIGIPPVYIDRGDPATPDFEVGDLTDDGGWHELDLSAIIPDGAKAVNLHAVIVATEVQKALAFRKHGNTDTEARAASFTQIANAAATIDATVGLSNDRKIDYNLFPSTWLAVEITVCGWWL